MATWDLFHLEDNFSDFIPFFIKFTAKKWKIGVKIAMGTSGIIHLQYECSELTPFFSNSLIKSQAAQAPAAR